MTVPWCALFLAAAQAQEPSPGATDSPPAEPPAAPPEDDAGESPPPDREAFLRSLGLTVGPPQELTDGEHERRAALPPREELLQAAASLDVAVRGRALATLVEGEGLAHAQRGLYDPNVYVRRAVVDALAGRPEPEARELLAATASRPDLDAWTRVLAAMAADAPSLAEVLRAAHASARTAPERCALALGLARLDPTGLGLLATDLAGGEVPAEPGFGLALASLAGPSLELLLPALEASWAAADPDLRGPLGAALVALGDPSGHVRPAELTTEARLELLDLVAAFDGGPAARMRRRLSRDDDSEVAEVARLARVAAGEVGPRAALRLVNADDFDRRIGALEALASSVDSREALRDRAVRAHLAALDDPSGAVRQAALRGLQRLGERPPTELLVAARTDEDPAVRLEAARLAWTP